ncbi:hypothetical protein [Streptomyces sp. SM11]|uniref:hypothetical protein n=1 Tax=Streptomyces sp. SM11 TaxID=565557 RepID=UPI00215608D2|nr:hypothetical protein [Streptomyces sp. SM11]
MPVEMSQEPDAVVSGGKNPGHGLGGVLAQADRPAIAQPPALVDEPVEKVRGCARDFFECGADRLGDQLQAGQVTHRGQDVGGIGALRGALAHQSGLLEAD